MKNPFQYGKIAENENFIDRFADREYLKQALASNTNVILMSPHRWGKSSLVKHAMTELTDSDSNYRVVYIDAFPITSSGEFYNVFARELLKATSNKMESIMETASRFLKSIAPRISFSPDSMTDFSLSFDFHDSPKDTSEILSLPEKIAEDKGIRIIVCIDEFQKLAKLPDYDKLEAMMRSVWQHQQNVNYCLYGSQRHMMMEIFNSTEKPFFRFGQMYNLKKIEAPYWIDYIVDRFAVTGKSISRELAARIADIAECHSWYVQQLASAVWNFTENEADNEAVDKALIWCIDVNSDAYQHVCDVFTDAQIGLLKAIAAGEEKLSAAATMRKYRLGTSASVVKNRRMLSERDIITASRQEKPRFLDPIFRLWFISTYNDNF